MSMVSKPLSEKICELINPNPVWEDPEHDYSDTTAKIVERSNEFIEDTSITRSALKHSKCVLLHESDNKYIGKKISRRRYGKESLNESSFTTNVDISSGDESSGSDSTSEKSSDDFERDEEESFAVASLPSNEDAESFDDDSKKSTFQSIKVSKLSAEIEKGNSVRNQNRLWDNLLEVRIQLQQCLVASNRLPPHNSFDHFKKSAGSEFQNQLILCKQEGHALLNDLLELQMTLMYLNSETRKISEKARKENDEIFSDDERSSNLADAGENNSVPKKKRKLNEISKEISNRHVHFKSYRDDTLQKWYLCLKAGNVKSSNFSAFDMSILKQIEHVLRDAGTLIKRTQKKRSSCQAFGSPSLLDTNEVVEPKDDDEFDCEIYNDDDFYQKLLRELIERKSADLADPTQLGRQWSELQKLRRNMKKKVDTKASKGRKIRYIVHSKLVNFMAPIPFRWNDSAMDDLFRSLFGKME